MTSIAVLMGTIGALLLLSGLAQPAWADPDTLYVAPDGDDAQDCSSYINRCRTVQRAVNVADPGDEILVAAGVYTAAGRPWVVDIRKSVTVRGGYSSDFSTRNPNAYPTTLDGEEQRQVVSIFGIEDITPTLEGLRLTRGSTAFSGGGIGASFAHPIISDCQIYSNTADSDGGGVSLSHSANAALTSNEIFSNAANWGGGGIYLDDSANAMLTNNEVFGNMANQDGGGIVLMWDSDQATLTNNEIHHNTAGWGGGGVVLWDSHSATLVNNVVVENRLTGGGSDGTGIQLAGSDARSLHTTIARNSGGNGSGVSVVCTWSGSTCDPSTIAMTNTILVSHTVGIEVREHNTATLAATLWGDGGWANGTDIGGIGGGTVVSGTNFWGNPAFVDADGGDYHIGPGAAINRGVDAGVTTDLDGDPRPAPPGTLPDLGADEFNQRCVYLPLVLRAR
jgi:parallel beta-helix repeat protein